LFWIEKRVRPERKRENIRAIPQIEPRKRVMVEIESARARKKRPQVPFYPTNVRSSTKPTIFFVFL